MSSWSQKISHKLRIPPTTIRAQREFLRELPQSILLVLIRQLALLEVENVTLQAQAKAGNQSSLDPSRPISDLASLVAKALVEGQLLTSRSKCVEAILTQSKIKELWFQRMIVFKLTVLGVQSNSSALALPTSAVRAKLSSTTEDHHHKKVNNFTYTLISNKKFKTKN